jgi:hypothetical protein
LIASNSRWRIETTGALCLFEEAAFLYNKVGSEIGLNQCRRPSLAKAVLTLYRAAAACAVRGSLGLRQETDF